MYKPTKDDRSNPFFKRYFLLKRLVTLSWVLGVVLMVLAFLPPPAYVNLNNSFLVVIHIILLLASIWWGSWYWFVVDDMPNQYEESKFGSIYNSTTINPNQEEVENTLESRSKYVSDYRTYLLGKLAEHRDHIAKSLNLGKHVYVTYPIKSEVDKLNRSWDFAPSSSGKSVAFANPYTFKESLIKLAFKNQDGTYNIKVIESWSGLLSYQGTALELPGYSLPLRS